MGVLTEGIKVSGVASRPGDIPLVQLPALAGIDPNVFRMQDNSAQGLQQGLAIGGALGKVGEKIAEEFSPEKKAERELSKVVTQAKLDALKKVKGEGALASTKVDGGTEDAAPSAGAVIPAANATVKKDEGATTDEWIPAREDLKEPYLQGVGAGEKKQQQADKGRALSRFDVSGAGVPNKEYEYRLDPFAKKGEEFKHEETAASAARRKAAEGYYAQQGKNAADAEARGNGLSDEQSKRFIDLKEKMDNSEEVKAFKGTSQGMGVIKSLAANKDAAIQGKVDMTLVQTFTRMAGGAGMGQGQGRPGWAMAVIEQEPILEKFSPEKWIAKLRSGKAVLSPDERQALINTATRLHEAAKVQAEKKVNDYRVVAGKTGLESVMDTFTLPAEVSIADDFKAHAKTIRELSKKFGDPEADIPFSDEEAQANLNKLREYGLPRTERGQELLLRGLRGWADGKKPGQEQKPGGAKKIDNPAGSQGGAEGGSAGDQTTAGGGQGGDTPEVKALKARIAYIRTKMANRAVSYNMDMATYEKQSDAAPYLKYLKDAEAQLAARIAAQQQSKSLPKVAANS